MRGASGESRSRPVSHVRQRANVGPFRRLAPLQMCGIGSNPGGDCNSLRDRLRRGRARLAAHARSGRTYCAACVQLLRSRRLNKNLTIFTFASMVPLSHRKRRCVSLRLRILLAVSVHARNSWWHICVDKRFLTRAMALSVALLFCVSANYRHPRRSPVRLRQADRRGPSKEA